MFLFHFKFQTDLTHIVPCKLWFHLPWHLWQRHFLCLSQTFILRWTDVYGWFVDNNVRAAS